MKRNRVRKGERGWERERHTDTEGEGERKRESVTERERNSWVATL